MNFRLFVDTGVCWVLAFVCLFVCLVRRVFRRFCSIAAMSNCGNTLLSSFTLLKCWILVNLRKNNLFGENRQFLEFKYGIFSKVFKWQLQFLETLKFLFLFECEDFLSTLHPSDVKILILIYCIFFFTQVPFKHESLLINDTETEILTGSEKRAAKRGMCVSFIHFIFFSFILFITHWKEKKCPKMSFRRFDLSFFFL